jgi:hypothetical protein
VSEFFYAMFHAFNVITTVAPESLPGSGVGVRRGSLELLLTAL